VSVKKTLLGFSIEGVGLDATVSNGIVFSWGTHAATVSDYEFIHTLGSPPQSVETSTNPYTGDWSVSAFVFEVDFSDRLGSLLMRDGDLLGRLTLGSGPGASNIYFDDGTDREGEVVWIRDEAILLGPYDSGNGRHTGCTRGYWSSTAQDLKIDDGVYDQVPYWDTRLVRLIEHDVEAASTRTRWRGIIRNIETVEDGTRIRITTEELLSSLSSARVNKRAINLANKGTGISAGGQITGALSRAVPRVQRGVSIGDDVFVQYGDGVIRTTSGGSYLRPLDRRRWLLDSEPQGGKPIEVERCYEVFLVDRISDYASTSDLTYPYHPLSIALALLTSTGGGDNGTYDILGKDWGLGVDFVSWAAWNSELSATSELVIDQLVLGFDGEPVDVMAVVQDKLLRPFGWFLGITDDGLIGLGRLRLFSIGDIDDASSNEVKPYYPDGPLQMQRPFRATTGEVEAEIGTLPWQDGRKIVVREPTRSSRRGLLGDSRKQRLDLSVIRADAVQNLGRDGADEEVNTLASLLQLQLDTAPRVRIRVTDYTFDSLDYDIGSIVKLTELGGETAWLIGPDGARVEDSSLTEARYHGMIIGRRWITGDATREHSYELTLLLASYYRNDYIRERAPSCVVESYTSGDQFECDTSDLGSSVSVDKVFAVGDEIELWTRDGERRTTPEVVTITSFPSSSEIAYSPSLSASPVAGQIVRLAESTQYGNTAYYSSDARPFTYLADSDETIDEGASDDEADIYGTEILARSGESSPDGSDFGGGTFYTLHDDAVDLDGDGSQPLDSYIECALRSNERWLLEYGDHVSWVPHTQNADDYDDESGIRAYTSNKWSSVLYIPWIISPGLESVTLSVLARAADYSSTTVAIDHALRLLDSSGRQLGVAVATVSQETAPEFHDYALTITLDRIPQREDVGVLIYEVQSAIDTVDEEITGSGDQVYMASLCRLITNNEYGDTAGARPSSTSLDLQCTFDASVGEVYEHMYPIDTNHSTGDDGMVVHPRSQRIAGDDWSRKQNGFLQVRGAEIHTVYQDLTLLAKDSHRSRIPVTGEVVSTHPIRTDQAYLRPRCLWVGPEGDEGASGWPTGYVRRWDYQYGEISGGVGVYRNIFISDLLLDTVDPTVLVLMHVLPIYADIDSNLTSDLGEIQVEEIGWAFRATIDQLEDGDTDFNTDATELAGDTNESDVTLSHYHKNGRGTWPALQTMRFYSGTKSGGSIPSLTENFVFKEGQLYEPDHALIQTVAIPVSVDNTAASTLYPTRLVVSCAIDPATLTDDLSEIYCELVVVGATIWEVPS